MNIVFDINDMPGFLQELDGRLKRGRDSQLHRRYYFDHKGNESGSLAAEYVVARALHIPNWLPRSYSDQLRGDVANGIEAKYTPGDDGHLIVRPNERRHRAFFLVTGAGPEWTMRGWIWGWQAPGLGNWQAGPQGGLFAGRNPEDFAWWVQGKHLRKREWSLARSMAYYAYRDKRITMSHLETLTVGGFKP